MVSMSIHRPELKVRVKDYHDGIAPEMTTLEIAQKDEITICIYFSDIKDIKSFAGQIQVEALREESEVKVDAPDES